MNNIQKTIGIVTSIVFIIMLLFPPFFFITEPYGQPGVVYDAFLLNNPEHLNIATFLLLAQMFGMLIVGAAAYFIASRMGYRKNLTGGLWEQKGENGHTFFSGPLSPFSKIYIVPNTCKDAESDPDYFFYLGAREKNVMRKTKTEEQSINGNDLSSEAYQNCKTLRVK